LIARGSEEPAATKEVVLAITLANATSTADIKLLTKEYFKDSPIMAEVARCESTYRQFNPDGSVLRGRVNGADVGVMQVNEKYHLARSKQLGINIYTLEGNLTYGKFLYKEQGTRPWNASKPCWGKTQPVLAVNN
jgi:hypothetical protein